MFNLPVDSARLSPALACVLIDVQVLQVDSTFKDNKWKFPLLEITATTNEMNTFLIAQALVPSESAESLAWVFEQVHRYNDLFLTNIDQ